MWFRGTEPDERLTGHVANTTARVARLVLVAEAAAAAAATATATATIAVARATKGAALSAVARNVTDLTALAEVSKRASDDRLMVQFQPCSIRHPAGRRHRHRRRRRQHSLRTGGTRARYGRSDRSGSRSSCPWGPRGSHGLGRPVRLGNTTAIWVQNLLMWPSPDRIEVVG